MTQESPDSGRQRNEELFTTPEAVNLYTRRLQNSSLFPGEKKAIDRYFIDTDATVLDVGCGTGRVSSILHERGFDVVGIDISEPLVRTARSIHSEIEFLVEDIRDTSFDTATFEYVIFSYFGIDYQISEAARREALREIRRLLKPSGVLVYSTHNSWHPLLPLSLRDLAMAAKDVVNLYLRGKNRRRIGSRYKFERVTLGELEIYLANPVHHWIQLRKCGFTPLDVIGKRDDRLRFFERQPHFVAKK